VVYPDTLVEGELLRRYKRFFADVRLDSGQIVVAHCPNTGRMTGCNSPGFRARVSPANNPKRKLQWTLEQVNDGSTWIGVHPSRANRLAVEAIESGVIGELSGYKTLETEKRYGEKSRIDILLSGHDSRPESLCYVEVKSTTLAENGTGFFPDAVTERGTKHLRELTAMRRQGHRAMVLFCVARADCHTFRPADEIDPTYGQTLRESIEAGVEAFAYRAEVEANAIRLAERLPVEL